MEHNFIVIEDVNPPSELRKVVLPSEEHQDETGQAATQIVSLTASVSDQQIQNAQSDHEKVDKFAESAPMPLVVAPSSHATQPPFSPASENLSQENPATPVTAQTLVLLTSRPEFDKNATPIVSDQE